MGHAMVTEETIKVARQMRATAIRCCLTLDMAKGGIDRNCPGFGESAGEQRTLARIERETAANALSLDLAKSAVREQMGRQTARS
ncbi:hypothetical protein [Fulvimarina endophytica]|uniref:hypothetical protein n=1 Tax=Fulvimarina endophytica TaxID=2293836 RepID=UPI0011C08174|nr:hypothetical protein [Fulvimarina endophytica]